MSQGEVMINEVKQTNLLEKWLKNAQVISSPFNLNKLVERKKVEIIYGTLLSFFGIDYFEIKKGTDRSIEKTSWIFSLLANENSIGCIDALSEIATLLKYVETLDPSIQKELNDLKNSPQNLRSFFFELFVYKRLDQAGIFNKKKYLVNHQIIEGSCIIADKEYLFECRKIFLPKIAELDIRRSLVMAFEKYGRTVKKGIGMIGSIKFNLPITGKHRSHFEVRIKEFFEKLNQKSYLTNIDYHVTDEYGAFSVIDYSEASLIEIRDLNKYDIIHYIVPPRIPIANQLNHYHGKIQTRFFTFQSKILKKLEEVLKEKKQQHKHSPFKNKIVFIDSEALPEFQMGLFINEMMFEKEKVDALCKKIHRNNIVCIIRRRYMLKGTEILVDTFGDESNKNVVKIINEIFKS